MIDYAALAEQVRTFAATFERLAVENRRAGNHPVAVKYQRARANAFGIAQRHFADITTREQYETAISILISSGEPSRGRSTTGTAFADAYAVVINKARHILSGAPRRDDEPTGG